MDPAFEPKPVGFLTAAVVCQKLKDAGVEATVEWGAGTYGSVRTSAGLKVFIDNGHAGIPYASLMAFGDGIRSTQTGEIIRSPHVTAVRNALELVP